MSDIEKFVQKVTMLESRLASLEDAEVIIPLNNKTIDDCMREHVKFQLRVERFLSDLSGVLKTLETYKEEAFSKAFVSHLNDKKVRPSSTEAKIMAESDATFVGWCEVYNDIYKMKLVADGILRVLDTRKYFLRDLTRLIVEGGNKYIL